MTPSGRSSWTNSLSLCRNEVRLSEHPFKTKASLLIIVGLLFIEKMVQLLFFVLLMMLIRSKLWTKIMSHCTKPQLRLVKIQLFCTKVPVSLAKSSVILFLQVLRSGLEG